MCGISGIIHRDLSRHVDVDLLRRMNALQLHRGPDDSGAVVLGNIGLGHVRLSVIDIEGGHQPMCNADESIWITFNGEIYNFEELRNRLQRQGETFRTHSDTEVIIKLYEKFGTDCLQHLNGMFAFCIVDMRRQQIFAARDRFGIKPLYYVDDGERFAFASEIKALIKSGIHAAKPRHDSISEYLTFQFLLGDDTLFQGVNKLLPAHSLVLQYSKNARPVISQYWSSPSEALTDDSEDVLIHELRDLLGDSVRLQMRSDVAVGCYLSGGLDSSFVTSAASLISRQPLHVFTGSYRDSQAYDETAHAQHVARNSRAIYHEVFPTAESFAEILPRLFYAMDEPVAGPGLIGQYFVSGLAAQHVKVVLGGQGGDELFGGYARYAMLYLEESLKGLMEGRQTPGDERFVVSLASMLPHLGALKNYIPMLKYFFSEGLFGPVAERYFRLVCRKEDLDGLYSGDVRDASSQDSIYEKFNKIFSARVHDSLINRMTGFDMQTLLPALLQVEDRMSMTHSIESRVPLLDHRIVEWMARVPPKIKFKGGQLKYLFREAIRNIVPDAIIRRQDKMGFPVPLNEWFYGPLGDLLHDILLSQKARERGLYNMPEVEKKIMNRQLSGRPLWGMISLEMWHRTFIDG